MSMSENGYIPNEIAMNSRDNDQQNHYGFFGVHNIFRQTHINGDNDIIFRHRVGLLYPHSPADPKMFSAIQGEITETTAYDLQKICLIPILDNRVIAMMLPSEGAPVPEQMHE